MTIRTLKYDLLKLLTALVLLPMATACGLVRDDYDIDEKPSGTRYINLTLYVNSDGRSVTRAPQGGENGDGREAGLAYENQVSGITVILYKGTGIDDPQAKVDFVKYFPVTLITRADPGTPYSYDAAVTYQPEARYTTGDQVVAEDEIDFKGIYHALIIANQNISGVCPKGTMISDIRDLTVENVYANTTPTNPWNAQQFVMTSERDATINFSSISPHTKDGNENEMVYEVLQPLLIERLSARIDYCTKGATYDASLGGYKYTSGDDVYVVTNVTPFNLYNGDEYLFKHVQSDWTSDATITYLGDESLVNYVVDPNTANKDNGDTNQPEYLSELDDFLNTTSPYKQNMVSVQSTSLFTESDGSVNVIIAYPKENTLMPGSYLMKYATGLAFEVNYYPGGTSNDPEKRVYYHYLRHQGELSTGSYQAWQWNDDEKDEEETSSSNEPIVSMNYGIVRNNIYRVSVGFTQERINVYIKVKKWDPFAHEVIYM